MRAASRQESSCDEVRSLRSSSVRKTSEIKKKPNVRAKTRLELRVILPSVGFDVGFAVLPALRAAILQGRVAWGLLMVSSGDVHSELPSGLAVAKMVISCDGA